VHLNHIDLMKPWPSCQTRITAISKGETPAGHDVLAGLIDEKPAPFRKGGVPSTAHESCLVSPRKHTLEVENLLSGSSWVKNHVSFKKLAGFGIDQVLYGTANK
jgi:hypothetical protein